MLVCIFGRPMTTYNLRYVARHLRYLPLSDLVGETVVLRSLRTASEDVIQHACTKLTNLQFTQSYDERQIEVCLAKHSFWDATWRVDGNVEWPSDISPDPVGFKTSRSHRH